MTHTQKAFVAATKARDEHARTCPVCVTHFNSVNWMDRTPCRDRRDFEAEVDRTMQDWIDA